MQVVGPLLLWCSNVTLGVIGYPDGEPTPEHDFKLPRLTSRCRIRRLQLSVASNPNSYSPRQSPGLRTTCGRES